ncbi:hypothetical protein M758_8G109900 [Ceratodon purpureus]|nr:hypothetical protein M758_8G109900 [Ceratodon purpureus]
MAGSNMGSFGGQNVMQLMRNDMGSSNSLVAMLASCNAQMGFQVPRTGHGGLEDIAIACGQKRPFYPTFDGSPLEEMDDDVYGDNDLSHPVEKKRRLSFDQVRSLERSFEVENKLEPERKMQLARELNLQPRQVAVWFQNRRARWKIKQLERDYEMLNSSYTKLKADLESTLREKDTLKAEVQRLSGKTSPKPGPKYSPKSMDSSQCDGHCSSEPTEPSRKTKSAPTIEVCEKKAETANTVKEQSAASSGSNESSSELLDSDSPRTVDSNHMSSRQEDGHLQLFPPESFVGPGDSAFPVKLELGCGFQADPNCNYFLQPVQPEQGVLPWWDQWA